MNSVFDMLRPRSMETGIGSAAMAEAVAFALKTILLPVDFDESNRAAAHQAQVLARYFKATVTLLHVTEVKDYLVSLPADALRVAQNRLEAFGADELRGVTANFVVSSGDPATRIVDFANHEDCDLILMPAHRHGPISRFHLGTVASQVLDRAKCPVWTVANSIWETNASAVRRVLCGVNFGPPTRNTIRWAASFANAFGAALSVMCVLPPEPPSDVPEWYLSEFNEGALPGLESRLKELLKDLRVEAEILIDEGDAATILTNTARSINADLVVVGRRSGEAGSGRDGNIEAIVRHAPCPVVCL